MTAIRAAQKRSEVVMRTVKPPEPMIIRLPTDVIAKIPESTVILHTAKLELSLNNVLNSCKYTSEVYEQAVKSARLRKEELLTSLEPTIISRKLATPVKYIRHNTVIEEPSINQGILNELSSNLPNLLRSNDKLAILEEFNKYQTSLRISIEEPYHKNAIEQCRLNRQSYLTSDD